MDAARRAFRINDKTWPRTMNCCKSIRARATLKTTAVKRPTTRENQPSPCIRVITVARWG